MRKLLTLALVCTMAFSLAACGGGEKVSGKESESVKLSSATDKWPVGVYSPFGIPEYTAGSIVYSVPNDERGEVYINTTREEMISYIDGLIEKGFHMNERTYEDLKTRKWESFQIYFPKHGGKYALYCSYNWENEGKGSNVELYDENKDDYFYIDYNLYFSIYESSQPEGWNKKDILTYAGLTDDMIMIEDAQNIVDEITTSYYGNTTTKGIDINFAFDYNLTMDFVIEYENKLVNACKSMADDGKVMGLFGELNMDEVKEKGCSAWTYTYQGKKLSAQILCDTGYGEKLFFVIQERN